MKDNVINKKNRFYTAPVSYTHLDVYKRQQLTWLLRLYSLRDFRPR